MIWIKESKQQILFIKNHTLPILGSVFFAIISFYYMLAHYSLTIDEETWINGSFASLQWVTQGRFGIWLINLLIAPSGYYKPIIVDWISVILWTLAAPIFLYSISEYFPKIKRLHVFFFCAYFSCVPFATGELLSYSMFNIPMSIAMISAAIACWFSMLYRKTRKPRFLIPAILFLIFSVSIYQAFINVYFTWCFACALFEALKKNKEDFSKTLPSLLISIALGALAIILYLMLNNLLLNHFALPASPYLSDTYIGWAKGGNVFMAFYFALKNAVKISIGVDPVYAGIPLLITTGLFGLAMFCQVIKVKGIRQKILVVCITAFFLISPFALFVALGTVMTPGRAMIALALAGAIEWIFVLHSVLDLRFLRTFLPIVISGVLIFNAVAMNLLFYNSWQVYLYDKQTAQKIIHVIDENDFDRANKPLVFIGMCDTHPNVEIISSGSTGGSFFEWDNGSNGRIRNFLLSEGYYTLLPTPDDIRLALVVAADMPEWPAKGSVADIPNAIVINFSQPTQIWYEVNNVE